MARGRRGRTLASEGPRPSRGAAVTRDQERTSPPKAIGSRAEGPSYVRVYGRRAAQSFAWSIPSEELTEARRTLEQAGWTITVDTHTD